MPYRLSATLSAHTSDVRSVCSPTDTIILSASRDTTAITWTRPNTEVPFQSQAVLRPGTRFVSAVAYIPPSPDAPAGYAITGGQDTFVNVFSLSSGSDEPSHALVGHTQNICALHTTPDGTIISGSWDRTAKVWKNFTLAYDLVGHQQSVWAVLAIDPDQFLTGAADNTIKLWHKNKTIKTYTGHTQAVRGLALISDIGFASCSNDSEIRIWTMEGDLVQTLSGHTSFVYSLSVLANGDLVSGGEDRTLRVWRDGECVQTIVHPAISVWAVSNMPNGDIVTGCSDGVVRVFSAAEERWAPSEQIRTYEDQVASTAIPAQQVGDVKVSDLPGQETLSQPGKQTGEVKMIRNGDHADAYQWDGASYQWQKIGAVVDAVGSSRKQLYQGKEYDYVFDVDVQEGAPPLKLPFNANENPYSAAQRFLQGNDLPLSYLDEVVKFIEKNASGVQIGTGSSDFSDPFTGGSRYRAPQGNSTPAGGASDFGDPLTGGSRYRPPASSQGGTSTPRQSQPPASSPGDPWTGGSRYVSGTSTPSSPPPPQQQGRPIDLPVRVPQTFRQANVPAMQGKLYQFDEFLRNEISTSSLSMYPRQFDLIDEAFVFLSQAVANPNVKPAAAPPAPENLEVVIQLLERWPSSQLFPVIDLARLIMGFSQDTFSHPDLRRRFLTALFHAAEWSASWKTSLPRMRETNILLLLRALSNAFQENTSIGDGAWVRQIFSRLEEVPYNILGKQPRIAFSTILFNISCVGLREPIDPELRATHVSLILRILTNERSDSESAYRALVALGNTAYAIAAGNHGEGSNTDGIPSVTPLSSAHLEQIREALANLLVAFNEERVKSVVSSIRRLL